MGAEYINPQWRLPNEKTGNSSKYSMLNTAASRRIQVTGLANDLSITDQVTMSGWMKPTAGVTQSNKYAFGFRGDGSSNGFDFGFHGSTCGSYANFSSSSYAYTNTTFSYSDGNWHHFVVSYNGSKHKIYIDGIFKAESSRTGNISFNSNGNFYMFNTGTSNNNGATGELVDVCVFDHALTDGGVSVGSTATGQIADLYASTNPMALSTPPKAYYPLGNSAHMGTSYLTPNGALQDYVFDNLATNSRILTPISVSDLTNCTQAVWFKTSTNAQLNKFLFFCGPYSTFSISLQGTDTVRGDIVVNPATSGASPSVTFSYADGKWHHYILNFDGSNVSMYIDGVLVARQARSGTLRNGTTFTAIGNVSNTNSSSGATGEYSNFIAYEHTLTDGGVSVGDTATGEIATLYNYGSPIRDLSSIPQNSNLKAWYKFDASEIYNSSSTEWEVNNAVSSYNNSLFVDNVFGNTSINGITMGSYSDTAGLSAVSWSLWVNLKVLNSASGYSTIINGNSFSFSTDASNGGLNWKSRFVTTSNIDNDFTFSTALQNQGWVNIIATYDGTNAKFYLNTAEQGTQTGSGVLNTTSSLNLAYSYGSNSVDAYFSNFSIWNKALNTSDISEIYNSGVPGDLASHSSTSNLINWWKLNNLSSGLQDSKGSSNATTTGTSGSTTVQPGSVSTLNGQSSNMSQANLVTSDLLTTSSYSPYSINFTGNSYIEVDSTPIFNGATSLSISAWCKIDNNVEEPICSIWVSGSLQYLLRYNPGAGNGVQFYLDLSSGMKSKGTGVDFTPGQWYHVVATWDGSFLYIYVDGLLAITPEAASGTLTTITGQKDWIGRYSANYLDGNLSNVAYWKDTALSASQVKEIYNEGRPSNLHTFSGTAPTAWWQLGSNSSFASDWTFLDEVGSNNVDSTSMLENAIADGVGTSGNGTSTNMGTATNISGSSPNGEGNSLSVNMTLANIAGGVN